MGKGSRRRRRNPATKLTDDLIVDIQSRLPVKSLCRFRSVSSRWNGLISDPVHRRRLPQTLAGLFFDSCNLARFPKEARHFTAIWERRRPIPGPPLVCPSFSFIPDYDNISLTDSCNGLLLCRRAKGTSFDEFCYVVCNPATESWVVLPDSGSGGWVRPAKLAFDPADSSHFHVFEFEFVGRGVEIYSSQTGAWSRKESEWYQYHGTGISGDESSVFFNGLLHLVVVQFQCMIAAVDVVGETWLNISLPEYVGEMNCRDPGFVGQYHGQLCYITQGDCETHMSIWVLEDYATEDWTLKHRVRVQQLTEKIIRPPSGYRVITIHPDCNWILYAAGWDQTLMAYDVDREEVHVIRNIGSDSIMPYIPYVPLYSGSLTDGH